MAALLTTIRLIYYSSISKTWSPEELLNILATSRRNNTRQGVTGMLLHDRGSFLQVLEGSRECVAALYATIERDSRHTGVTEILRQPIEHRDFPEWAMGWQDLRDVGEHVTGYMQFLRTHFELGSLPSAAALELLRLFKPSGKRGRGVSH